MAKILANTKDMSLSEWRQLRKKSIGGSDAAAILGCNPFVSPFSLYVEKKVFLSEKEDNLPMILGRKLEQIVAELFMEKTGKKVQKDNKMYIHDDYDFISANIDRKIVGENAGLECKTTTAFNKSDFKNGEIPLYYYCQCMHYMAVMGFKKMYLAILVGNAAFYTFEIDRDEEEIKRLIDAELDFWNIYILNETPPPIDGSNSTAETLKLLNDDVGEVGDESIYLGNDLDMLVKIQKNIKELEKQEKEYKNKIIFALKNNSNGFSENYTLTYKSYSKSSIDSKGLKKALPDVFNNFSKTTYYKKMTIKEAK